MERPTLDTFGFRLRAAMRQLGIGNEELAEAVGVHPKSISRWLSDRQIPERATLARIATALTTDADWLLTGRRANTASEPSPGGYALSDADVAAVPGVADMLLRMPDHVHAVAWPFLGEMARVGVSKAARDQAEVFLTHLSCGMMIPGYPSRGTAEDIQDAQDAIAFLRRVYARRGVEVPPPAIDLSVAPDPDAISGEEMERRLASKQRKPKAG